jgi:hypothetical protein
MELEVAFLLIVIKWDYNLRKYILKYKKLFKNYLIIKVIENNKYNWILEE